MIVRELGRADFEKIKKIHEKFYREEFSLPNFARGFVGAFVVVDDDDSIICAGGVKSIAESIIVTNKDAHPKLKREALYNVLNTSAYICNRVGYDQLHAFIQDEKYLRHLLRAGFRLTAGKAIVMDV